MGAYLRGNLIRCGIVGILTGLGLFFLGMPFSFVLGLMAGVFNIIYYIGPYLAAIPAVILSFSLNTPHPVVVIFLYIAVQTIDGFVLSPVLLGKAVDLQPFTVIVSLMIGGVLLGILGLVIAVPTAGTLKVIIQRYYLKEKGSGV